MEINGLLLETHSQELYNLVFNTLATTGCIHYNNLNPPVSQIPAPPFYSLPMAHYVSNRSFRYLYINLSIIITPLPTNSHLTGGSRKSTCFAAPVPFCWTSGSFGKKLVGAEESDHISGVALL